MIKHRKSIFATLILIGMLVMNFPAFAQKANNNSQSSNLVWIVYTFNFPCPQTNRNKKIARYEIGWSDEKKLFSGDEQCSTNMQSKLYNGLGFVLQVKLKKPVSVLRLGNTQNCTASRVYREEPPEYNDDRYRRVDWYGYSN